MPQWTDDTELWRARIYHQTLGNVKLHLSQVERARLKEARRNIKPRNSSRTADENESDTHIMSELTIALSEPHDPQTLSEQTFNETSTSSEKHNILKPQLCLTASSNLEPEKLVDLFRDEGRGLRRRRHEKKKTDKKHKQQKATSDPLAKLIMKLTQTGKNVKPPLVDPPEERDPHERLYKKSLQKTAMAERFGGESAKTKQKVIRRRKEKSKLRRLFGQQQKIVAADMSKTCSALRSQRIADDIGRRAEAKLLDRRESMVRHRASQREDRAHWESIHSQRKDAMQHAMQRYKMQVGRKLEDGDWDRIREIDAKRQAVRASGVRRMLVRQIDHTTNVQGEGDPRWTQAAAQAALARLEADRRPRLLDLPRLPALPVPRLEASRRFVRPQQDSDEEPKVPPFGSSTPARLRGSDKGHRKDMVVGCY